MSDGPAKIREHLRETKEQLKRLDVCLEACGDGASGLKDTTMSLFANIAATAHAVAPDEVLKNTFANNAFENYEIAAYKSLLALCSRAGLPQAQAPLQASLAEEQAMAQWIDSNVEAVTMEYLAKEERAQSAA